MSELAGDHVIVEVLVIGLFLGSSKPFLKVNVLLLSDFVIYILVYFALSSFDHMALQCCYSVV